MTIVALCAVAGVIVAALLTVGFVLNALDKILDSSDRDAIRERVENFWFRTASLELHEQFQLALRSRYAQMRRLQPTFMLLFVLITLLLAVYNAGWSVYSSASDIREFQQMLIKSNLDLRYSFLFSIDVDPSDDDEGPPFKDADGQCTFGSGFDDMRAISELGSVKASLTRFLDKNEHTFAMRAFTAVTNALVPLVVGLPLLVGLFVSFNLTLWLLSRFTQSRLGAIAIVAADILLALVMPTIVSGVLLTVLTFAIIFSVDGLPDYAMFPNPTWTTLTISSVSVLLAFALSTPVAVALWTKQFSFAIGPSYIFSTIAEYSYGNAKILFVDLGRVLKLDLDIQPVETLINYAIGIDLLFSLFYIVPCLSLVLMQRSNLTRKLFLNIVQWTAEHPKGPLVALEEIVTAFAKYLVSMIKR